VVKKICQLIFFFFVVVSLQSVFQQIEGSLIVGLLCVHVAILLLNVRTSGVDNCILVGDSCNLVSWALALALVTVSVFEFID
jgi:protein-S-isoprenylcysteine O-methyltransferase Ste14